MARRILILMCLLPCLQLSSDLAGGRQLSSDHAGGRQLSSDHAGGRQLSSDHAGPYCRRGQFYKQNSHGHVSCVPCREGTYMDQDAHTELECSRCSEPDSVIYQVKLEECTPDSNTLIGCAPNYFKDDNQQCKLCKDCQHDPHKPVEVKACTPEHDTVCCGRGMRAEKNPTDGLYDCVDDTPSPPQPAPPRPINETCNGSARACGRGQYLLVNCSSHNPSGSCQPCGDGTFMNVSLHNLTSCMACTLPRQAGLQVQSVCNRTHDVAYMLECVAPDTSSYDTNFYVLLAALGFSICLNVVFFRVILFLKGKLSQRVYL